MHFTETTSQMLRALAQAKRLDLDKLFGSGIDVTLHRYSGEREAEHVERVTVHAEFAGPLRAALIEALEKSLERRRESLVSDLAAVNAALDKAKT
ncbi:hypothetical protein [Coralloluteibacterium stylophorae]|uniref:Uncharacterized protein n=1 Tax=Coralloluteibacterium stylophorae TaxID=1776034 RepID=A0A8J7VRC0_9GAMM|nr:hypothetical protein [Coralloluteibacterium stylophorae]MBS7457713.1 hypothetical protein [Coralloluteibacterium stylophorae]